MEFTIGAESGELMFRAAPDFENPTDEGANNVYVVEVRATDSDTLSDTLLVLGDSDRRGGRKHGHSDAGTYGSANGDAGTYGSANGDAGTYGSANGDAGTYGSANGHIGAPR